MLKTSISSSALKANVKFIQEAFHKHSLIKIRKTNGQIIGPGHIAIMYGEVAFRLYSEPVSQGSHFLRIEEIAELLPAHDGY
jgi:hypothetical protein